MSYLPRILHRQDTVAPFHLQELSSILGEYQLRDTSRPILDRDPIEVVQFFSFYCSRCFVFDQAWTDLLGRLPADVVSRDVPIVFDSNQPAWPAVAYLAAREQGRGEMFKQALFDARFNKGWHINEKFVVLDIAEQLGMLEEVRLALDDEQSNAFKQFRQGLELRERFNVHATPFVLINDNLYVTPQHSADNTNLMVENLQDILLDMQCRQYGNCDVP